MPPLARGAGALLAGAAVLVVALVAGTALQRVREPVGSPQETGGTGLASSPGASGRALAFLDRGAFAPSLILLDDSGKELRRVPFGTGGYGSPAIHPQSGRLALWRFPERDTHVPAELVVWDGKALRVLARITDLSPWGGPVWSADGGALYFSVASPPSEGGPTTPPRVGRLVAVDASSGTLRTLRTFEQEWPIVPVVARADLLAGFEVPLDEGRGRYITIDPRSGQQLSAVPREHPFMVTSFSTDRDGMRIAGLSRRFESAGPTPLRVWPADDYSRRSVALELRTMTDSLFWPGRSEILVTGAGASNEYELLAVTEGGATRSLFRSPAPIGLGAIASDASALVLSRPTVGDFVIYPLTDTGIGTGTAFQRPSVTAEILGWVALGG